jgi:hypothetical protein
MDPSLRVAVLQSNYLPWKGYFDLIHDVDLFVFYDDVQYTKNDWRNRNRIKTVNGEQWITIPIGSGHGVRIDQIQLERHDWQRKHWESIRQGYAKAPHFSRYKSFFEDLYLGRTWQRLSELNQYAIKTISAEFLGARVQFACSDAYKLQGGKQERLLNLLQVLGATEYLSGPAGRAYIDEAQFAARGIRLSYKSYDDYPAYPQQSGPFNHYVSVVDLLFMTGDEAPRYIWGQRLR